MYDRIVDARGMDAAWRGLDFDGGLTKIKATLARRGVAAAETDATVTAYVSESRWVAQCQRCPGGVAVWLDEGRGVCPDCGAIYRVTAPQGRAEGERALVARPEANRNWQAHRGETVAHLLAENERVGL